MKTECILDHTFNILGMVAIITLVAACLWFLNGKHKSSIAKLASPPTPQLIFFNAGPCQYIMVRESNALAIAHQGNCTNHSK